MILLRHALLLSSTCAGLSACYVVPVQTYPSGSASGEPQQVFISATTTQPAAAPRPTLMARLYPVNNQANAIGMVSGSIANFDRGRGEFAMVVGSETYQGEATRSPNSTKGTANAVGNRGGYVKCDYTMASATVGSGTCLFSNGARFDIHVSNAY